MPIYEYRCEACGAPKEAIQKMSDDPLKLCDECGQEALTRIISRTNFVLKGTGWYATDYKPAPKEAKAEADSKSESGSDSKSDSSSKSETSSKPTTAP